MSPYEITNGGFEIEPPALKKERNNTLSAIMPAHSATKVFFSSSPNCRLIPNAAGGGAETEKGGWGGG